MAAGCKEQSGPGQVRPAFEQDFREFSVRPFDTPDGFSAKRNVVFCELSRRLRTNLRPIAASHHISYPILHHDGKLRSFISPAICRYRFSGVFESVTVKTMMHRNTVERLDTRDFGEFVDQARRKKDFRSTANRAIRTDKIESFFGPVNGHGLRVARRHGLVARE